MSLQIKKCKNGIQFSAYILPRSSQNKISGLHGKVLKIKITSPPVDGEANKMLIKFLAKILKITPSKIFIISGSTNRNKSIMVEYIDEEEFKAKLNPLLAGTK